VVKGRQGIALLLWRQFKSESQIQSKDRRISPSSRIASSVGLMLFLLPLPRLLPLDKLTDFVTARAPVPPALTGLPLPSLACVSFAFRVLAAGGSDGAGVGSTSDGTGSSFSVSFAVSGSGATVDSSSWSSSCSSSDSCIMTEPLEGPRDLPLVRRLDVLVALDVVRGLRVVVALGEDLRRDQLPSS
jgi:hypothetical protein